MSDLLREIDEDVAKEKSEQFIEKWGLPIGVFLVIIIVGLFFYFNWQSRSEANAVSQANNFAESTEFLLNDPEVASALLTDLSLTNSGFAHLAEFKVGDSLWNAGEREAAVAAWQSYVQSTDANPELANTVRFKIAWFGNPYLDADEIISIIEILEATPAYVGYGPILRAVHALSQDQVEEAQRLLNDVRASEIPGNTRDLADALHNLVRSL